MCIMCMPGAHRGQERGLEPLEQEFHVAVSHLLGIEPGCSVRLPSLPLVLPPFLPSFYISYLLIYYLKQIYIIFFPFPVCPDPFFLPTHLTSLFLKRPICRWRPLVCFLAAQIQGLTQKLY